jgi:uncharacterized protein (UPF0261 family)
MVAGVLDLTTTEWADELVGGVLSAGPKRMDAVAKAKVPAVIAPGCLDMVNFGERISIPEKLADRTLYIHNPQLTLLRTNSEECSQLGKILAEKVNQYTAPAVMLLPKKAISVISAAGQAFHDPAADKALFDAICEHTKIPIEEWDEEINSPIFAQACAKKLLELMEGHQKTTTQN